MTAPTPTSFQPDWLNVPLNATGIQAAVEHWTRRRQRLETVYRVSFVLVVLLFVPGMLLMDTSNGWRTTVGGVLMVSGSMALLVGAIASVYLQVVASWLRCFKPLAPEDQVKFDWMLNHAPTGQALREHLIVAPRPALHGELDALSHAQRTIA